MVKYRKCSENYILHASYFLQNVLFMQPDDVAYQVTQVRLLLAPYRKWSDCSLFVEDFRNWRKTIVHIALLPVKLEIVELVRQNNPRSAGVQCL